MVGLSTQKKKLSNPNNRLAQLTRKSSLERLNEIQQDKWKVKQKEGEIRCFTCGFTHPNPTLCETYRTCHNCSKILRDSSKLVVDHCILKISPLLILAASYGHPTDPKRAISVVKQLQDIIDASEGRKCLQLSRSTSLISLFQCNPSPGVLKSLKIRYHMYRRRGELQFEEHSEGHLKRHVTLKVTDAQPKVSIYNATYGHSNGSSIGNQSYNITEQLVGLLDCNGMGDYLEILSTTKLSSIFGDPCNGVRKKLMIEYEIIGRSGEARQYEKNGHLLQSIKIKATPVISPTLIVLSSYYGCSLDDIERRKNEIKSRLYEMDSKMGSNPAIGRNQHLSFIERKAHELERPVLEKEMQLLSEFNEGKTIEIAKYLQEKIDNGTGGILELDVDFNFNRKFGDPVPGLSRYIIVTYYISGLGASNSDDEITSSGHQKNFLTRRNGSIKLEIGKEGFLRHKMLIEAKTVLPALSICRASFGHPTNILKTFDITEHIGVMSCNQGGGKLEVARKLNLIEKFGDPCRGVRKALVVKYQVRGMVGRLQLEECKGCLQGKLQIGYPPNRKDKGDKGKSGILERISSSSSRGSMLLSRGSTMSRGQSRNSSMNLSRGESRNSSDERKCIR